MPQQLTALHLVALEGFLLALPLHRQDALHSHLEHGLDVDFHFNIKIIPHKGLTL